MLISRANPVEKYTFDKRSNKLIRHIYMTDKKGKTYEVLKQFSGTKGYHLRYIDFANACGWLFYPPGTKMRYYYGYNNIVEETKTFWFHQGFCSIVGTITQTYKDIINLFKDTKYKDFVYTLKSLEQQHKDLQFIDLMLLFENYTKNNKVELLVKADLPRLAYSKKFLSLNKEKQKKILNMLKNEKDASSISIGTALKMLKWNCSAEVVEYQGDKRLFNLIKNQHETLSFYNDYKRLVVAFNHDINEEYWKYPSDLRARHNRLNEELRNIEETKRAKERKALSSKIKNIGKKLSCLNQTVNGYSICVATDLEDIEQQAGTLSQCLITCKYYEDYANKKCILVFIKKGEERLATAEVFYQKENALGQFYGDEKDRENCLPSQEIKDTFNMWLTNTFIPSKFARV